MVAKSGNPFRARVVSNVKLTEGYYLMRFESPGVYLEASPGQFLMLRTDMREAPLLSRAFSICSVSKKGDVVTCSVLYRLVGITTELMSMKKEGDFVYILGPLGRGFDLTGGFGKAVLVSGGTGIAPILFLSQTLSSRPGTEVKLYYGARSAGELAGLGLFADSRINLKVCTDDGSAGERCAVTALLEKDLGSLESRETAVFACGPVPMLKSLKRLMAGRSFPVQISVEEKMACGIGACLSCAVRTGAGYVRACKEGPVFGIDEVEFA